VPPRPPPKRPRAMGRCSGRTTPAEAHDHGPPWKNERFLPSLAHVAPASRWPDEAVHWRRGPQPAPPGDFGYLGPGRLGESPAGMFAARGDQRKASSREREPDQFKRRTGPPGQLPRLPIMAPRMVSVGLARETRQVHAEYQLRAPRTRLETCAPGRAPPPAGFTCSSAGMSARYSSKNTEPPWPSRAAEAAASLSVGETSPSRAETISDSMQVDRMAALRDAP